MSDLKDFQGTVFNSAKTVVTKTLVNQKDTSGNVTGDVGLELTDMDHTISSDVQSVIMMGTLTATAPGGACWHILRCWRNEVPVYAGNSGRAASFIDTLVGSCVIGTDGPGFNTQSASFVFVDNNIGDSTQQTYRWTIWTSTSSDSRELEVKYLTNPMWDLRNL
jgi:hypothetical protein|tara:strand:+ start:536 stop:1027 length:492 start_codon:yes stop_codon:yes gene_type:complete